MFRILLILAFVCTNGAQALYEKSKINTRENLGIEDAEYRREFCSPGMKEDRDEWSDSCLSFLEKVERDSVYFPIPESVADQTLTVSYVDSWMADREYKGKSRHEGTDIMADKNERGLYPVISISDGMITNLGWLEKGGYRIGITSPSGVYYYYAHLESYAEIKEGDRYRQEKCLDLWVIPVMEKKELRDSFRYICILGFMPLKMGKRSA